MTQHKHEESEHTAKIHADKIDKPHDPVKADPHQVDVERGAKLTEVPPVKPEAHVPPAKAVPPHPLAKEADDLRQKIAKFDQQHRDDVAKLREEVVQLYAKIGNQDLSVHNQAVFSGMRAEIDGALNILDPDCSVKK